MSQKLITFFSIILIGVLDGALSIYTSSPIKLMQLFSKFAPLLLLNLLLFWWLHNDNKQYSFKRSPLFNVGIVAMALVFVPIYIFKTRVKGKRLKAITSIIGLLILFGLFSMVSEGLLYGHT
jgi:hypothetical protein